MIPIYSPVKCDHNFPTALRYHLFRPFASYSEPFASRSAVIKVKLFSSVDFHRFHYSRLVSSAFRRLVSTFADVDDCLIPWFRVEFSALPLRFPHKTWPPSVCRLRRHNPDFTIIPLLILWMPLWERMMLSTTCTSSWTSPYCFFHSNTVVGVTNSQIHYRMLWLSRIRFYSYAQIIHQ